MKYKIGDQVCLIIDKSIVGVVINIKNLKDNIIKYQIFHNQGNIQEYYENQIILIEYKSKENKVMIKDFLTNYIVKKMAINDSETLYALNSGKIKFIPFQFRPLSKILKSENKRILIADEVGVGKTIEAGIILKEFEKREDIQSVVVVCPRDLIKKWQGELRTKFDEAFDILTPERLRYCIKELTIEGEWPPECRKCIIGLELLRREENVKAFLLTKEIVKFDMLIVDEAHHIINRNSKSHEIVKYFCENSERVIFLSATPLQLQANDLYSLLNLLDPSEFIDEKIFLEMIEPNKYINNAIRILRDVNNKEWQENTFKELNNVFVNNWSRTAFLNNKVLNFWLERLNNFSNKLSNEERVKCINDLESVHTLSHIINRTKRKDIGEFTVREPITVSTDYTEEEREFYNQVKKFRRNIFNLKYNSNILNFLMTTIERQITSCIPSFVMFLDEFIKKGLSSLVNISDDLDIENEKALVVTKEQIIKLKNESIKLKKLAKVLPKIDFKLENLIKILNETKHNSRDGKVLVFSFFKNTLNYLYRKLKENNFKAALITGETPMIEREKIRNKFRMDKNSLDSINVLLCSEVGCEGLDYEFCSRIVNYDIPWNPMKIEQRIGRIDRFGQKSSKVQIYNFITPDTIEERVFFRCYERLGIFRSTIGDLEEILGEIVFKLSENIFDFSLTKEQMNKRTNQLSDNAIRMAIEQREFEKNSKDLYLLDLQEKGEVIIEEKHLQVKLLKELVIAFFNKILLTGTINENDDGSLKLRMYKSEKQILIQKLMNLKKKIRIDKNSDSLKLFEKYLYGDTSIVLLYFEYTEEVLKENIFININHLLVKLALDYFKKEDNIVSTNIRMKSNDYLEKGKYIFICYDWRELGYRKKEDIKIILYDLKNKNIKEMSNLLFEKIIFLSEDNENNFTNENVIKDEIEKLIFENMQEEKTKLNLFNENIVNRKLSSLDNYYKNMIERLERDLSTAYNEKIKIMRRAQLEKTKNIWKNKGQELKLKLKADIVIKIFANGYLEVK